VTASAALYIADVFLL